MCQTNNSGKSLYGNIKIKLLPGKINIFSYKMRYNTNDNKKQQLRSFITYL